MILCDNEYFIVIVVYFVCWFSNENFFNVNNIFINGKILYCKNVDLKLV